mmetsp:Transcript_2969/g.2435  ORF Transcript_2969/g.2435 Transcript_2969/m.2435 type:complete len:100 (+) Transcript_2969:32-331(+)
MFDQCCRRPDSADWLNEVTVDDAHSPEDTPKIAQQQQPITTTPTTASPIDHSKEEEEGPSYSRGLPNLRELLCQLLTNEDHCDQHLCPNGRQGSSEYLS